MEGLERLENEVLEMNDYNVSAIFNFLKTKNELLEKFNNAEKTIKQMYKFICDKARNQAKNNVAMVNDRIVYIWAMTYFNKTNEELGIKKEVNPKPKADTKTKSKTIDETQTETEIKTKIEQKDDITPPKKEKKPPKVEDKNQVTLFEEVKK